MNYLTKIILTISMKKINKKHTPLVISFFMSLKMAFSMSLIVLFLRVSFIDGFFMLWIKSALIAWIFAFPLSILYGLIIHKKIIPKIIHHE